MPDKKKRKVSENQRVLNGIHNLNISSREAMVKVKNYTLREAGYKKVTQRLTKVRRRN